MRKFIIVGLILLWSINAVAYPKLPASQVSIGTTSTGLMYDNLYDQLVAFYIEFEKAISVYQTNTNVVVITQIEFSPHNRTYIYVPEDAVYRSGLDYEIIPTVITPEGGSPTDAWMVRLYDMDQWRNGPVCYASDFPVGPWRDQSEFDYPIVSGKGTYGYRLDDSLVDTITSSKNLNLGGNMITNVSSIGGINNNYLSFAPANILQYNGEDAFGMATDDGKPEWLGHLNYDSITNAPLNLNISDISGSIIPSEADLYDLGSAEKPWRHLYVAESTIYLGTNILEVTNSAITINNAEVATETNIIDIINSAISNSSVSIDETDPVAMGAGFITSNDLPAETDPVAMNAGFITTETDPIAMSAGFITSNDLPTETDPVAMNAISNLTASDVGALSINGGTMSGSIQGFDSLSSGNNAIDFEDSAFRGNWDFESNYGETNIINFLGNGDGGTIIRIPQASESNQPITLGQANINYVSTTPSNIVAYGRELNFYAGALYGGWNFRSNLGETNHYDFEDVDVRVPVAVISNQPVQLIQLESDTISGNSTQSGTNKNISFSQFISTPIITCTFAESLGELAQIEILSITTTNFIYQIRTGSGIVTNGWSVNWIATK